MKLFCWVAGFIFLTAGTVFAEKTAPEYFSMATQFYNAKDYQGAYFAFEAGLKVNPASAAGYQGLGNCLYSMGRQSEAMEAYQKSLELDPKNDKLAAFVKTFKPLDSITQETDKTRVTVADTEALSAGTASEPVKTAMGASRPEVRVAIDKMTWAKAYVGYDYALLADFKGGLTSLTLQAEANPNSPNATSAPVATTSSSSILVGAEFGIQVDPGNGFSLSVENAWTENQGFSNGISIVGDPNQIFQASFQPQLFDISLNYYAYLARGKGERTYLQFGGGFYQATVGFSGWDPNLSVPNESGTFSDSTFGGTVGVGETLALGDTFALDIFIKARIAAFNQLSASQINNGGTTTNGPYGIAINQTTGSMGVMTSNSINNGYRNVTLDYSGLDGSLAFDFYF
jgi:tetratricopeptide (TPR) repeat protein